MIKGSRPQSLSYRNNKINRVASVTRKIQNNFQRETSTPSDIKSTCIRVGGYKADQEDLLGRGFCSNVYKAVHEQTGQEYALKWINMQKIKSAAQKRFLKNQIKALQQLQKAKHVIHLHQIVQTRTHLGIVTELCKTSVSQLMKNHRGVRRPLEISQALKIFEQSLLGYLAMRNVELVHRDIKTANILLGMDGTAQLCDLGFATTDNRINEDRFINVGSPLYMAPQIIRGNNYSSKGDVWALGLVLLEMLIAELPWRNQEFSQLRATLLATKFQDLLPATLQTKMKVIILGCLQFDPRKRLSALEVIKLIRPDFDENVLTNVRLSSQQQSQQYNLKSHGTTTLTTIFTEGQQCRRPQSNPQSRLKIVSRVQEDGRLPIGLRGGLTLRPGSQSKKGITGLKSYSSKRLRANTKRNSPDNTDNLISLKLNQNSSNSTENIKRQQYSNLHLVRLLFKTVQLIDKSSDNIHCTYLNINQQIITSLIGKINQLFQGIKMSNSQFGWKEVEGFRRSKEFKHFTGVCDQYQRNYLEYFRIRKHSIIETTMTDQPLSTRIGNHIEAAHRHFELIFNEIQISSLERIGDQEICEFIVLGDYLITLTQMLNLKVRSPNLFSKTSIIEGLLKRPAKILSLMQIRKIKKKIFG